MMEAEDRGAFVMRESWAAGLCRLTLACLRDVAAQQTAMAHPTPLPAIRRTGRIANFRATTNGIEIRWRGASTGTALCA